MPSNKDELMENYVKSLIREIPDFPKAGVNFKDITPLLRDKRAFQYIVDTLSHYFIEKKNRYSGTNRSKRVYNRFCNSI